MKILKSFRQQRL